ncbi:Holliday junction resolvase RuvX [Sulfurospirillum diekertiae]|uniref:Putative pre-16S rRNA nuclease n=1 Tax=Sulfurospirillum diekertiae TaxID=1854492 RepID=A0A6G9VVB6_9BACT|nr:Holliday junction resolvase RuvX [Sulfurospirillum diekertiae]QIR76924.1 Holliday junction resolvase RuvX [Sulfurospirillum diekertiae]QIR79542.1 Holliday junction resolvase RuvX [Sulfurospirillum diekertiae]
MKKTASIDIGLKRIGVALSLAEGIVSPQEAILRKNRDQAARDVDAFLNEWSIELLVVGLPKGGSSSEEMERRIKHFVSLLAFSGEVVFQDEYGSSNEAKEMMQGITRQKRDGRIDSMAAKVILERYFDTLKARHG